MSLLALQNISKAFGGTQALSSASIDLNAGRVHAIVGENGAGKSTLIKIIMGVLQPDAGQIVLDGKVAAITTPSEARRLGFSCVYQEPLIFPHLSVLENIFIGHPVIDRFGNFDTAVMREKALPIFRSLGLDPDILPVSISKLRLGYQQLVLIAQALVYDSRLIMFDEPTSILSGAETDHLFDVITFLRQSGKAVVYISHRLEELLAIADEATVLTDGRVVGHTDRSELEPERLLALMAGKATRDYAGSAEQRKQAVQHEGTPVLSVEHLTLDPLFRNVSFSVHQGEVLGLYGQVGAGRSEVALSLFGYLRPKSGTVRLRGQEVRIRSPRQAIAQGIGYLPEDRKLQGIFSFQSISSNLISTVLPRLAGPFANIRWREVAKVVNRFRTDLNIKMGAPGDPIISLSGGGQQKVMIARWMAVNLSVAILDEPTRGIDVVTKRDLHDLIRSLAEQGLAIIVISSDLPEVLAVSTRIMVMNRGSIVASYEEVTDALAEDILGAAIGMPAEEEAQ